MQSFYYPHSNLVSYNASPYNAPSSYTAPLSLSSTTTTTAIAAAAAAATVRTSQEEHLAQSYFDEISQELKEFEQEMGSKRPTQNSADPHQYEQACARAIGDLDKELRESCIDTDVAEQAFAALLEEESKLMQDSQRYFSATHSRNQHNNNNNNNNNNNQVYSLENSDRILRDRVAYMTHNRYGGQGLGIPSKNAAEIAVSSFEGMLEGVEDVVRMSKSSVSASYLSTPLNTPTNNNSRAMEREFPSLYNQDYYHHMKTPSIN